MTGGEKTGTDRPWLGSVAQNEQGQFILGRILTLGHRAKKVGAGVDGRCSSVRQARMMKADCVRVCVCKKRFDGC